MRYESEPTLTSPPPRTAPAPGPKVGRFEIESELGRGGMGVVYRAHDHTLRRDVALKVVRQDLASDPAFRTRFRREAAAAAAVEHPHVLPVHGFESSAGVLAVVMRLIDGPDLRGLLDRVGPLEPERAVRLARQLCSALGAIHARGLVHRDVKPRNVLIAETGPDEHAYVADFGIARAVGDADYGAGDRLIGTVGYAAPEQIRGDSVDQRADIYGLGCVLFEMLTGKPPYGGDRAQRIAGHLSSPVPGLPGADPRLETAVRRALAKSPADRFESADAMAAALDLPFGRSGDPLPRPANRTIGRDETITEVASIARRADVRVLTLIGPGGVGKTRVALEVARVMQGELRDGTRFAGLEALRRAEQAADAIAATLGVVAVGTESADDALFRHLEHRQMLLVLDNLEHLPDATPLIGRLADGCAGVTILATSRAPLGLRAERRFAVAPLPDGPAVELFAERAEAVDQRFYPDRDAVEAICRRVDGLPLAIELAAARCTVFSAREIAARLGDSLGALGTGARDSPARQRTLRATVQWSYELLDVAERECFVKFAAFSGGATVEAAEAVTGATLNVLSSLVSKSLLVHRDGRLRMLETVRAFAAEQFAAARFRADVLHRHYEHFAELARAHGSDRQLRGPRRRQHAERLAADHENLTAALSLAVDGGDAERGLALAVSMAPYWLAEQRVAEALHWLDAVLDLPGAERHPTMRVHAMTERVQHLWTSGRVEEQRTAIREAERLARALNDPALLSRVLQRRAYVEVNDGDLHAAAASATEALQLAIAADDVWEIGASRFELTLTARSAAELRERLQQAIPALEKAHDTYRLTILRSASAYGAVCFGDARLGRELVEAALPAIRALDDPYAWAIARGNFGLATLLSGDFEDAENAFMDQLIVCRDIRILPMAAEGLLGMAAIATARSEGTRAARLYGASNSHSYGQQQDAILGRLEREFLTTARERHPGWDVDFAHGAALSFDEAIAYALGSHPPIRQPGGLRPARRVRIGELRLVDARWQPDDSCRDETATRSPPS